MYSMTGYSKKKRDFLKKILKDFLLRRPLFDGLKTNKLCHKEEVETFD